MLHMYAESLYLMALTTTPTQKNISITFDFCYRAMVEYSPTTLFSTM